MGSLTAKTPKYFDLAYTKVWKPKVCVPGGELSSADEFCNRHGFGQTEAEVTNSLNCCPAPVRAAIAMHYMWDQLVRSNWRAVQLLAFAYVKAAHTPDPAIAAIGGWTHRPGTPLWSVGRIRPATNPQSAFSNRLLHALAVLEDQRSIRAVNADMIDYKECREGERCGNQNLHDSYRIAQDDVHGYWCNIDEEKWHANHGHRLKRAPHGLVVEFFRRVRPLFQPYLEEAFDHEYGNGQILNLHVRVQRPRSHVDRKLVTVGLLHVMEELVDVLPEAVSHAAQLSYHKWWKKDVALEIDRYRTAREEFALQSLASRNDLSASLQWYDANAEAAYLTPKILPRPVCQTHTGSGLTVLAVPGLNRERVKVPQPATAK